MLLFPVALKKQNSTGADLTMNVKNVDCDFMVPQDGYTKGDDIKSLNETKVNNA